MGRIRLVDTITLLTSSYIVSAYAVRMDVFQSIPGFSFIPILTVSIALTLFFTRSAANKTFGLFPKKMYEIGVYYGVLTIVLILCNLNSIRPIYSIYRVIVALFELSILSILFWQTLKSISFGGVKTARMLSWLLVLFIFSIIVGQITIPEWRAGIGGIRMSGGSNPNRIGFFAFFAALWSHYCALKFNRWSLLHSCLFCLAMITMVWSLSRTVLLGWVILYSLYFSFKAGSRFLSAISGYVYVHSIKYGAIISVSILLVIPFIPSIGGDFFHLVADMEKVEQRISGGSGLESRVQAWHRLWDFFEAAPITGKAGWWNSTNVLPTTSSYGIATSPHNLYIRLLSEVGIVGFMAVMLYPVVLSISLLVKSFMSPLLSVEGSTYMFLFASIVSVFAGQFFEDRYLVGIMSINNAVVIFVLTAGLYELVGASKWQR